ncbi:hypothetical protein CPB85DRAFT_1301811 [Mucidula mucida]|nr:hypothetical protein CPB85DRAFT_1301811 [Mucidula mucida]
MLLVTFLVLLLAILTLNGTDAMDQYRCVCEGEAIGSSKTVALYKLTMTCCNEAVSPKDKGTCYIVHEKNMDVFRECCKEGAAGYRHTEMSCSREKSANTCVMILVQPQQRRLIDGAIQEKPLERWRLRRR